MEVSFFSSGGGLTSTSIPTYGNRSYNGLVWKSVFRDHFNEKKKKILLKSRKVYPFSRKSFWQHFLLLVLISGWNHQSMRGRVFYLRFALTLYYSTMSSVCNCKFYFLLSPLSFECMVFILERDRKKYSLGNTRKEERGRQQRKDAPVIKVRVNSTILLILLGSNFRFQLKILVYIFL